MPVIFDRDAADDVREAQAWYEQRRQFLGLEFVLELDRVVAIIQERPATFPIVHRDARRALMRRFPYLVLFVDLDDAIVVVGVFHTARDPKTIRARAGRR
jgi:plasmid stabilization system protein ParE